MACARIVRALPFALLSMVALTSCDSRADDRRAELDRLARTIEARLDAAELPTIPHGEPWTPAGVRVIAGEALTVDRAATALDFFSADRDAYAESRRPIPEPGPQLLLLPEGRVPTNAVSAGGTLPALAEALRPPPPAGQMGEGAGEGQTLPPHRGPLDLSVGSKIPYATFAPILRTVVRERYTPRIVLPGPGEVLQLPVHLPAVVGGCRSASCIPAFVERRPLPEGGDQDAVPDGPTRLELTIAIGVDGVNVFGSGGVMERGCARIRSPGDQGNTVPRRSGTIDRAALADCLQKIDDVFPEDDVVLIQPDPTIRFNEVAMVASLAYAEGRFPELLFAAPE